MNQSDDQKHGHGNLNTVLQEANDITLSAYTLNDEHDVINTAENTQHVCNDMAHFSDHDDFVHRLSAVLKDIPSDATSEVIRNTNRRGGKDRGQAGLLLLSLEQYGRDWKRAFEQLPINIRLMFINSVQSLIWNAAVEQLCNRKHSHRSDVRRDNSINEERNYELNDLMELDVEVREGDLVCVDGFGRALTAWDVSNSTLTANSIERYRGLIKSDEKDNKKPIYVHVVSADDFKNKKYDADSLILPMIGRKTIIPSWLSSTLNESPNKDISSILTLGNVKDDWMRVPGSYRHVFSTAKNINSWDFNSSSFHRSSTTLNSSLLRDKTFHQSPIELEDTVDSMWANGKLRAMINDVASADISDRHSEKYESGYDVFNISFTLCSSSYASTFVCHILHLSSLNVN